MNIFFTLLRILFGLTFITAAVAKAAFPVDFAAIVANYQILPEALVNPVALLLPWLELVCGAALITGVWVRGAATLLCGLLVVFIAALGYNEARGLSVSCGCFSVAPEAGASMRADLVRDAVLLAVGLLVLVRGIVEERRRLASVKFWSDFNRPVKSAFNEPTIQNGVLIVGGGEQAAGGSTAPEAFEAPKTTEAPETPEAPEATIAMPSVDEAQAGGSLVEPGAEAAGAKDGDGKPA